MLWSWFVGEGGGREGMGWDGMSEHVGGVWDMVMRWGRESNSLMLGLLAERSVVLVSSEKVVLATLLNYISLHE
jgi:hypothetical protein